MAQYKPIQGDTLTGIAQKFGTTPDAIAKANNISNPNLIYAGVALNIPESSNQTQQISSTMPANASIINPKSTVPAPAVITPSLAETTTKKNLSVLYNAESIPKVSQSSTPVLSVSSTNPTVSANIEKINQALSDPKLASLLTPEIRQAISNINSLGTQAQTLASSARNSADTQDYRSLNDYVKQLQETKKKVDESTMTLQSQLQPLRDRYIASLNPSQEEIDLGSQLNNIRSKIADFNISAVEGQQAEFGLGRPLALSTGRAEKLGQQAALTRQSLLNEESNLLSKLGLAQEARRAQSEGLKTGISMLESDIALQDKAYERIRQQEADVFTRFQALNTIQRQNAADILESLKGVDPSTLSPEVRSQIAQVAESRGIPSDAIFAGLQTEFTKNQLDILSKREDIAYKKAQTVSTYKKANEIGQSIGLNNQQIDNARAIASSFENSPIVKNFLEIQDRYLNAKTYAGRGDGATDIAVIYDLMKVLDPTSVVREAEYNTGASKSGNIFSGGLARLNGLIKPDGGFISEKAKENIFKVIDDRYNVRKSVYDNFSTQKVNQVESVAPGGGALFITDYSSVSPEKIGKTSTDLLNDIISKEDKPQEQGFWDSFLNVFGLTTKK